MTRFRTITTTTTTPTITRRRRGYPLVAVTACSALALGACGGDDAEAAEICEPYLAVSLAMNGEPDPATLGPLLDDIDENAPEDLEESLGVMTTAAREVLETGDFAPFESPEFAEAQGEVDPWMFEECDFDGTEEVTAEDYSFDGLPDELDAGTTAILFTNEGEEAHELALMRKAEGVTQSWDEILALPQEEGEKLVEQVGGTFAPRNGTKGLAVVELTPGEYVAACFVPTGTTMSADGQVTEGTGVPHFMGGMVDEFTVTE